MWRGIDDRQGRAGLFGAAEGCLKPGRLDRDNGGGLELARVAPARGASLGVEIENDCRLPGLLSGNRQVDRQRCLAGAALLAFDCKDFDGRLPRSLDWERIEAFMESRQYGITAYRKPCNAGLRPSEFS